MGNYVENGITFNNVKDIAVSVKGAPYGGKNSYYDRNDTTGNIVNVKTHSFNIIDVDWCGAQLGDNTINTTGQLLAIIKNLQDKVNTLETAFSTLATNVGSLVTLTNSNV